jgi:hypothetical protein
MTEVENARPADLYFHHFALGRGDRAEAQPGGAAMTDRYSFTADEAQRMGEEVGY